MRAAFLLVLLLLAGCIQTTPDGPGQEARAAQPEQVPGEDLTLEVTVNGQATDLAMTYWRPAEGASVVVLALHGSAGARWNHGPTTVPGYSFAHAWTDAGHAVAAIDYPGYGDSPEAGLQTMEELAEVTAQVAEVLRNGGQGLPGHEQVVGFGISMGGLQTQLTQARHGSFDAIISASWSYGGFDEEYQECVWSQQNCPEDPLAIAFHLENMDPAMIEFLHDNPPSTQSPTGSASTNQWAGCPVTPEDGPPGAGTPRVGTCAANEAFRPQADEVTQAITVPVLLVFGEEDRFWADVTGDAERFTATEPDELYVPGTGHVVIWHRTHDAVMAQLIQWTEQALAA